MVANDQILIGVEKGCRRRTHPTNGARAVQQQDWRIVPTHPEIQEAEKSDTPLPLVPLKEPDLVTRTGALTRIDLIVSRPSHVAGDAEVKIFDRRVVRVGRVAKSRVREQVTDALLNCIPALSNEDAVSSRSVPTCCIASVHETALVRRQILCPDRGTAPMYKVDDQSAVGLFSIHHHPLLPIDLCHPGRGQFPAKLFARNERSGI